MRGANRPGHVLHSVDFAVLPRDIPTLVRLLRDHAARGLAGLSFGSGPTASIESERCLRDFRDEAGNRQELDWALIASLTGADAGPMPRSSARDRSVELWWSLFDTERAIDGIVTAQGPLTPELRGEGIEVWTLGELAALHAIGVLASLAPPPRRSELLRRSDEHVRWLIAELQPDNGTNLPWGVQAFLRVWAQSGDLDAHMYADTLLHNCTVTYARPDRRSALILESAARTLPAIF